MLGSFVRAARPDDWTGKLAKAAMLVLTAMALVPVLLARLPEGWVALALGQPWLVRIVLAALVLFVLSGVRAVVYSRLPRSPYLVGQALVVADRGAKRRIGLEHIEDVFVSLRPPPVEQAFCVALRTGEELEVCPVHWAGAGRLYAALQRKRRRLARRTGRADRPQLRPGTAAAVEPATHDARHQRDREGGNEVQP